MQTTETPYPLPLMPVDKSQGSAINNALNELESEQVAQCYAG